MNLYRNAATIALTFLTINTLSSAQASLSQACENYFGKRLTVDNKQLVSPTEKFIGKNANRNQLNASWEISRDGIGDLARMGFQLENALYYKLTGLLAAENILVDGAGGAAKTFLLRKAFEAQLHAVNKMTEAEVNLWIKDRELFLKELLQIIQTDKQETDRKKKVFTLQMHAGLSESKLIGAVNAFRALKENSYKLDYKKALIQKDNVLAIIDEIEKAPVAIQMTLLSILAERQALVGNKVINVMLESVAATTNATAAQLISQALPYEVGGRMALLDRFGIKIHMVNVTHNATESLLLVERVKASKSENRFTIIDLRGLRPLLAKVVISKELLEAARDIEINMAEKYTRDYDLAKEEAVKNRSVPNYYPPYSGSTRSAGKMDRIWSAAFLLRQLMMGVPFESARFEMKPQDLVDLAPLVLHGGADFIIPKFGARVEFYQKNVPLGEKKATSPYLPDMMNSNIPSTGSKSSQLSEGFYDFYTQTFSYKSANTHEFRKLYFDVGRGELIITDPFVREELVFDNGRNPHLNPKKASINQRLASFHSKAMQRQRLSRVPETPTFARTKRYESLKDSTARKSTLEQESMITQKLDDFLEIVNVKIAQLGDAPQTRLDRTPYEKARKEFLQINQQTAEAYRAAVSADDWKSTLQVAGQLLRNAYKEYNFYFKESLQDTKAILLALMTRSNLLLAGPPGSGKTLKARIALNMALRGMSEEQVMALNSVLAQTLVKGVPTLSNSSIYVKQFHPMSSEGEILGRLNLKAFSQGKGFINSRKGTMSANNVTFALLDEFEKAPPQVRTALLSIMNERAVFDGDKIVNLAIVAVVISTNNTSSEFLVSLGDFSTAFPLYDRIQLHAYVSNKLSAEALLDYLMTNQMKVRGDFSGMLSFEPLRQFAKSYKISREEQVLLSEIYYDFMRIVVPRSEQEIAAYEGNTQVQPQFFMNTRGESSRSLNAIMSDFSSSATFNRALNGKLNETIESGEFKFDLSDLLAFGEQFLNFNNQYRLEMNRDSDGMLHFSVAEGNYREIESRLDTRDKIEIEYKRWEIQQMAQVLNAKVEKFLTDKKEKVLRYPNLYPSLFASREARIQYLLRSGFSKEEIEKHHGKVP